MAEKLRYNITEKQARAFVKLIKTSSQKLNLVASMVRDMKTDKALNVLEMSTRKVSVDVKNAILSAIANAENNKGLDVDKLYVAEAYVGKAMKLKRFRARARGRAAKIFKSFANLTIVVEERQEEKKADVKTAVKKTTKKEAK